MSKTALKNPSDRKAYIITGPTSGIGRCYGTGAGQARHGRPGRTRPRKARRDAEDHRAEGPARGVGRVRLVGSRERASRGCGDRRASISRSLVCSTMRASCRCALRRTRWAGT